MTFHKVVKAPAKIAHIGNFRRKKAEDTRRRMVWLLGYVEILADALVLPIELGRRLDFYIELKKTITELNGLPCYNGIRVQEIIITAKFEHTRRVGGLL